MKVKFFGGEIITNVTFIIFIFKQNLLVEVLHN